MFSFAFSSMLHFSCGNGLISATEHSFSTPIGSTVFTSIVSNVFLFNSVLPDSIKREQFLLSSLPHSVRSGDLECDFDCDSNFKSGSDFRLI